LAEIEHYQEITKEEVVKFANDFFKENYVAVYKEKGENENLIRVENPGITPVKINRDEKSEFLKEILAEKSTEIETQFIDYQKEITETELDGKKLSFVKKQIQRHCAGALHFPFWQR